MKTILISEATKLRNISDDIIMMNKLAFKYGRLSPEGITRVDIFVRGRKVSKGYLDIHFSNVALENIIVSEVYRTLGEFLGLSRILNMPLYNYVRLTKESVQFHFMDVPMAFTHISTNVVNEEWAPNNLGNSTAIERIISKNIGDEAEVLILDGKEMSIEGTFDLINVILFECVYQYDPVDFIELIPCNATTLRVKTSRGIKANDLTEFRSFKTKLLMEEKRRNRAALHE